MWAALEKEYICMYIYINICLYIYIYVYTCMYVCIQASEKDYVIRETLEQEVEALRVEVNDLKESRARGGRGLLAVCCSLLQCVAVWCSVVQCVAVCCSVLQCVAVCCSVLQSCVLRSLTS